MRRLKVLALLCALAAPSVSRAADGIGAIAAAACTYGPGHPYNEWQQWFHTFVGLAGVGPFAQLGANEISGTGQWSKGDVNVNLGPTSAGSVFVCFTSSIYYYRGNMPRVIIQEYFGNGLWLDLWSSNNLLPDHAYGYWFTGLAVRRIRLLVRENEDQNGRTFYWAGSY